VSATIATTGSDTGTGTSNPITTPNASKDDRNIGSFVSFYKNGEEVGIAFRDITRGEYYPAVSLYFKAAVSVNFGPTFKFEPQISVPSGKTFRPISDLAQLHPVENMMNKEALKQTPETSNGSNISTVVISDNAAVKNEFSGNSNSSSPGSGSSSLSTGNTGVYPAVHPTESGSSTANTGVYPAIHPTVTPAARPNLTGHVFTKFV